MCVCRTDSQGVPPLKHTVCLRHVDPSPFEGLKSGLRDCALPAVTAVCSPRSRLSGGVFIRDATGGFLDPFLRALSLSQSRSLSSFLSAPTAQPNTAVVSDVIRPLRGAFGCHAPCGIICRRGEDACRT